MPFRDFDSERKRWGWEVDRVAADLVRRGVPPRQAIDQASKIVSERRREQATSATESQS